MAQPEEEELDNAMEEQLRRERVAMREELENAMEERLRQERVAMREELENAMEERLRQERHAIRMDERSQAQAIVQRLQDELATTRAELASVYDAVRVLAPRYAHDIKCIFSSLPSQPVPALPDALVLLAERNALTANGGLSCKRSVAGWTSL